MFTLIGLDSGWLPMYTVWSLPSTTIFNYFHLLILFQLGLILHMLHELKFFMVFIKFDMVLFLLILHAAPNPPLSVLGRRLFMDPILVTISKVIPLSAIHWSTTLATHAQLCVYWKIILYNFSTLDKVSSNSFRRSIRSSHVVMFWLSDTLSKLTSEHISANVFSRTSFI